MDYQIYKTREEAQRVCNEYLNAKSELMEKFSVWEVNDDTNVDTYIHAEYLDKDGKNKTHSHY